MVCALVLSVLPAEDKTKNLILVTMDGLRWQELFHGADSVLISNPNFVENGDKLREQFWAETPEKRRENLMPFFWETIASDGQLYGNHAEGSVILLTNSQWFSYPGYNEILTGYADPEIDSNDKKWNRNVTFLEYLNRRRGFEGRVAAFCSWDVFRGNAAEPAHRRDAQTLRYRPVGRLHLSSHDGISRKGEAEGDVYCFRCHR